MYNNNFVKFPLKLIRANTIKLELFDVTIKSPSD